LLREGFVSAEALTIVNDFECNVTCMLYIWVLPLKFMYWCICFSYSISKKPIVYHT